MGAGNHTFSVEGKCDVISGGITFHCLVPEVRYMAPRGPLLSRCVLGWAPCAGLFSFSEVRETGACIFSSFFFLPLLNQLRNEYTLGSAQMESLWVSEHPDFFVECLCCLLYHWQSNLIPHEYYNKTQIKVYMGNQALWSWTSSYNTQPTTRVDKCRPGSLTSLSYPSSCVKAGLDWIISSSSETPLF